MVRGAHLMATIACACAVVGTFPGAFSLGEQIEKFVYNNNGFGAYSFEFETSDGTYRREDGGVSDPNAGMVVRGEYRYTDRAGHHHFVRYIADNNGFQPLDDDDARFNDRRIF